MPRIMTIAREYGSGGRLIAQRVAEKLGLVYYDNEVIDIAAKELGIDVDTIRKASEEKTSSFMYTMSSSAFTLPKRSSLWQCNQRLFVI